MAHPQITSFPETHFFDRGFGGQRRWILHETLRGWYLWYLLVRWLMKTEDLPFSAARRVPAAWSKAKMVEIFCEVLDSLAKSEGARIWVEKTPRHLEFVEVIEKLVPTPKFIHIVRDGRSVVASLHRLSKLDPDAWSTYRTVDNAVERWNRSIRRSAIHAPEVSHVTVSYDSLAKEPEPSLRAICSLLDVQFDPQMVTHFREKAAQVVKPHESWKQGAVTSSLEHTGLEKYYDEFSEQERARIESELDWETYQTLGYRRL